MARKSADDPSSWSGTRTVAWMSVDCGFCTTPSTKNNEAEAAHECVREIAYFDKLWLCSCECNADWKPVAVVVERDGTLGAVPENLFIAAAVERKRRGKKKAETDADTSDENTSDGENQNIIGNENNDNNDTAGDTNDENSN